jgi:hypothetical protein
LIQGASTVGGIAGRYATVTNSYHIGPDNSIGTLKTLGQLKQHSSYSNWNMGIWGLIENATTPSLYIEDNYWIGSGNWSSPANWSRGRIPSIQDIVRFDNFSINNCTIDVPVIVGGISIGANYIGTITQSQSLDVLNDFIQQNGTFLQNAPIIVRGIITKWPLIT